MVGGLVLRPMISTSVLPSIGGSSDRHSGHGGHLEAVHEMVDQFRSIRLAVD